MPEARGATPVDLVALTRASLEEGLRVKRRTLKDCGEGIAEIGGVLIDALRAGSKVLCFGNGGSAADAQHFASELAGRFVRERPALPAIALTANTSDLTAIGNDYGFERIFDAGSFELSECTDVPYKVIINEAVELTKLFGAEQGHKFVNGVIDKIARQLRPRETGNISD